MKLRSVPFHQLPKFLAGIFCTSLLLINPARAQSNPYGYSNVGPYFYRFNGNLFVSGNSAGYRLIYTNKTKVFLEGSLPGSFVNKGRFSPGLGLQPFLKARTLKILRDFTQTSTGVLQTELASNQVYDRLEIGETARLGGTLQIVSLNGYKAEPGDSLKILTAGGGVTGTFAQVDQRLSLAFFDVIYSSDAVELKIAALQVATVLEQIQKSTDFNPTPNQLSVARAVDASSRELGQETAFSSLLAGNISELPHNLDLIAPEEFAAFFRVAQSQTEVHFQTILDQLAAAREDANEGIANPPPEQSDGKTSLLPKEGKATVEAKTILANTPGNPWSVWATGSGDFVDVGDDANAKGFGIQSGGLSVGADYRVSSELILGMAGGYTRSSVDLSDNGNLDVDGARITAYGTWYSSGAYVNALLGGGYNSFDTHRTALNGSADGNTDGGELDALLSGGYDFKKGPFTFGPTLAINYIYADFDSFQENGSDLPLDIASHDEDSLRSRLGGYIQSECRVMTTKIRSKLSLEWQHDYLDTNPAIEASFRDLRGPNFQTRGGNIGTDAALVGADVSAEWSASLVTYFHYEAELGRENYDRQTISAGLRWSF